MYISTGVGIFMVLLTTFMWGSWFQFVHKIGRWPVASFMLWLYTSSFVIVWIAVFALEGAFIPEGIVSTVRASKGLCLFVLVCGALFAVSMQIQMMVLSKAGLIFCTSVTAMVSIPYGFLISSYFGGISPNISFPLLILGVILVFSAGLLCQRSTRMRDADQGVEIDKGDKSRLKYMLVILLCHFFLGPSYTLAMSIGTKTDLRPAGLPSVLLIGILSCGSLIGTWVLSGIRLTRNHQWKETFSWDNRRYIGYACLSGVFHYGGNLIHTIAIPVLSMAIAWPLGNLSSVWQYLWGLVQGEFKGVKKATYIMLLAGVGGYILALIILTAALYL